ncbi:TetR/AcrR family transcriptional regulator [Psychroflexus sp. MES1-P1E]|jgi:TetR/AcrR family transcriptional repressor of nem operon|uniref:TetR/AcrR family transcriptional regulator n=1 Tax=Psychroflexus sp. MES1-P1E TaxID=2058320 RepID=UPI000C7E83E4|nr:TetR/AcrR family transcriptional regulator [Psychroflexus sp. MES1-P1E]PKG43541.1 TetR/AcrR family transcriptional regulator [Psychroflexus sp. MES1-P1E]
MPRVKLFDENEVLSKATELFWKKGYHATSIQDLVSFLGINRGSLYDTYGGKKELFDKAFEFYRSNNSNGITAFFKSQNEVKKGFRKLFEMGIDESVADIDLKGCFVVNTTTELIPGEDSLLNLIQDNKKLFEGIFYSFLLKGQQNGEIAKGKNIKTISCLFYTFYSGLKVVAKVEKNPKELMNSVDEILMLLD